ncbi:MAG TPA: UbiA family prenyltransferase [Stellaceae bacterium]|nr:UbiA family prenyltransferase [Stellaceae bacterium]
MSTRVLAPPALIERLWIYQRERFPLGKTGVLLAVFSAASVSVSAHLSGRALPGLATFAGAWAVAVIFFFQLRACDEIKDREDDRRFRPERPIPRGLVSLRLIVGLGFAGVPIAAAIAAALAPALLAPLALVWLWLALMTAEFFVPDWLKRRPFLYLVSHMAIMPLIDLFETACEWLRRGGAVAAGLLWFLGLSFANGCVIELGRKVWAPENERPGVETYSGLLGPRRAAWLWAAAASIAFLLLVGTGFVTGAATVDGVLGGILLAVVWIVALRFVRRPEPGRQKLIDAVAGLWVLVCYASAGFAPFLGLVFR